MLVPWHHRCTKRADVECLHPIGRLCLWLVSTLMMCFASAIFPLDKFLSSPFFQASTSIIDQWHQLWFTYIEDLCFPSCPGLQQRWDAWGQCWPWFQVEIVNCHMTRATTFCKRFPFFVDFSAFQESVFACTSVPRLVNNSCLCLVCLQRLTTIKLH